MAQIVDMVPAERLTSSSVPEAVQEARARAVLARCKKVLARADAAGGERAFPEAAPEIARLRKDTSVLESYLGGDELGFLPFLPVVGVMGLAALGWLTWKLSGEAEAVAKKTGQEAQDLIASLAKTAKWLAWGYGGLLLLGAYKKAR